MRIIEKDLSKIIIVDNTECNFKMNKDNGILIHTYLGEYTTDRFLYLLKDILKEISSDEVNDLRISLKNRKEELKNLI